MRSHIPGFRSVVKSLVPLHVPYRHPVAFYLLDRGAGVEDHCGC